MGNEMFTKIGYDILQDNSDIFEAVYFKNDKYQKIVIYKNKKEVGLYTYSLTFEELKAINEKIQEIDSKK